MSPWAAAAVVLVVLIAALFVLTWRGDTSAAAALARMPNALERALTKWRRGDDRDDAPPKKRRK